MFATSPTADSDYEQSLRDTLGWGERGLDLLDFVLLGLGPDGHTASLFPHTPPLHEQKRLVVFNEYAKVKPSRRVTMTYSMINAARFVCVLITGSPKAGMIARVATGRESCEEIPILGVRPLNGELRWYLDGEACGVSKQAE
jgi:6-phosphogluconolactonase